MKKKRAGGAPAGHAAMMAEMMAKMNKK